MRARARRFTPAALSLLLLVHCGMKPPEDRARRPWAYLITFSCYGTKLHGRQSGSVDRNHNAWKGRYVDPNRSLRSYEHGLLKSPCGRLDVPERTLVLKVIKNVCSHEEWIAHAVHVRTNHVHLVVAAEINPAALMGKLKAYASRALNSKAGHEAKRWARHGSLVWLWEPNQVDAAVDYVVRQQGYPMAVFENMTRWEEHVVATRRQQPAPEPRP